MSHIHSGEGNGDPLQCSCLENPMDREAWQTAVCGVAKNQTQLSEQHTYIYTLPSFPPVIFYKSAM